MASFPSSFGSVFPANSAILLQKTQFENSAFAWRELSVKAEDEVKMETGPKEYIVIEVLRFSNE